MNKKVFKLAISSLMLTFAMPAMSRGQMSIYNPATLLSLNMRRYIRVIYLRTLKVLRTR